MKIFVSHSTKFNFVEELYKPLRNSELNEKHEIILPHENGQHIETKDIIRDCDLVVAEVSYPSTGQGIELGWANESYVTIVCFYKTGTEISGSLKYVSESIIAYDSVDTIIQKIKEVGETL
jgi:hypothetical protein